MTGNWSCSILDRNKWNIFLDYESKGKKGVENHDK